LGFISYLGKGNVELPSRNQLFLDCRTLETALEIRLKVKA